ARAAQASLTVRLKGGEELLLPNAATPLLTYLLMEMGRGNAVAVFPIHAELTTQQAADYLNVSRPYLISLLENDKIPFHTVGRHRRVRFLDLCAFKAKLEARRQKAMEALAELDTDDL
ncbi:MAG: uncharacterized protein JWM33_271, partial [Caulobacteraceae bacterium]|nr:uncharacterized protein [Caulobacteraceae bacterium]